MPSTVLTNAMVFTGDELLDSGAVVVENGLVVDVRRERVRPCGASRTLDLQGRYLMPGFIDIQVNGGGGVLFNSAPTLETLRTIGDAHARFGTTSFMPTLISDSHDVMRKAVDAVRRARRARVSGVLGIHLEGPFLNPEKRGAHDATKLGRLDEEGMDIQMSLGTDGVTLVTLAPEMTAPAMIERLCSAGVVVFAGHSAADYEQSRNAISAGVSGFTHLFNAMTPMGSRAPGMVGAALESADSVFSIIADGHHVHPASLRVAIRAKRPGKAVLISDAMPTVGSPRTWFELNGERIELQDGVLRNSRGSLAGAHLTLLDAVGNVIRMTGVDWWEAVSMAACNPAGAIGVADHRGYIRPGYCADFVELDEHMRLHRTWIAGVPTNSV